MGQRHRGQQSPWFLTCSAHSLQKRQSPHDPSAIMRGSLVVGVLLLRARRPGICCQTVFAIQHLVSTFLGVTWRHLFFCEILTRCTYRIRDLLRMRYINLTLYLLTYLGATRHISQLSAAAALARSILPVFQTRARHTAAKLMLAYWVDIRAAFGLLELKSQQCRHGLWQVIAPGSIAPPL